MKEIYGTAAEIETYDNCVTLQKRNSSIKADIVPAFRNEGSGGGWLIPDVKGKKFIITNPRVTQLLLTQQNKKMNGKLIPLIKKIKALNKTQNWKLESSFISTKLITELESPLRDSRHALREGLRILATSPTLKSCRDPGVPRNRIKNHLSEQQLNSTQRKIQRSYENAKQAKRVEIKGEKSKALKKWEQIAGKEFYE